VIPLYGFLQGDSLGLLVFGFADQTIADLATKLQNAAAVRVELKEDLVVLAEGKVLNPALTVSQVGLTALDRFDVQYRKDYEASQ